MNCILNNSKLDPIQTAELDKAQSQRLTDLVQPCHSFQAHELWLLYPLSFNNCYPCPVKHVSSSYTNPHWIILCHGLEFVTINTFPW